MGDRDDQGRFGRRIEMSVADRFLRVRFRVSPQGVSPGDCGAGIRYGVLYIFYVLENGDHRVNRLGKVGRSCKKED